MKALLPFLKRITSLIMLMLFFAFTQKSFGQAATATWNPNSSITPSATGNITASSLSSGNGSLGSGVTGSGTYSYNSSTYGIGGEGWSTSPSSPGATSSTYAQFQITPNSNYSFSLTSFSFNVYTNDGNDRVSVYWSTSSTFSTYGTVGSTTGVNSGNNISYTGLTGISAASGQSLYIRVVFYYMSSNNNKIGVLSSCIATGTTTAVANLTASSTSLSFPNTAAGNSSATQTFNLSGTNLSPASSTIAVTAPQVIRFIMALHGLARITFHTRAAHFPQPQFL